MRIQTIKELEAEMRAAARGEVSAAASAARPSLESAAPLLRVLTPETRAVLRTMRDAKPRSVAALARLTDWPEPELLRTLKRLEAFGLVEMRMVCRRRVPVLLVGTLHLMIDPYAVADTIEVGAVPGTSRE